MFIKIREDIYNLNNVDYIYENDEYIIGKRIYSISLKFQKDTVKLDFKDKNDRDRILDKLNNIVNPVEVDKI